MAVVDYLEEVQSLVEWEDYQEEVYCPGAVVDYPEEVEVDWDLALDLASAYHQI